MNWEYAEILSKHSICSIQDLGRSTYNIFGIPQGGAMDSALASEVNEILNNPAEAALIELFQTELNLIFQAPTLICLGGFRSEATINGAPVELLKPLQIKKGDAVKMSYTQHSPWRYIGIIGGWQTPATFGSKSTYLPLGMDRIGTQSKLFFTKYSTTYLNHKSKPKPIDVTQDKPIKVNRGFDAHMISNDLLQKIFSKPYQISHQSNRQAYINVDAIDLDLLLPDIISSVVYPGTLQLTPAGKLYIIMKDGQTTGGYLRVGQLTPSELDRVVRLPFGSDFEFDFD